MTRFLADENFNGIIVRGLRRRLPDVEVVRVQDVGLRQADDPTVLAYAADNDLVLLTHDVRTIKPFADERTALGLKMTGVIEVAGDEPVGRVIDDLVVVAVCSLPNEWEGQFFRLPIR